ncbi:MAG: helix-turn-helix domain-containing protein [Acidobacteria bacterium]|nr:helix-turn-helix domain-containing protein [Acidobacteriota bacterium]
MKSVGETLRKEREARGILLQEISEETKISIRLLRAIEEDHFELLPGGLFNRNFIRQYARYLGLDEEAAVQEYLKSDRANGELEEEKSTSPSEIQPTPSGTGYFRVVVTAICLGALAVVLAYGMYRLKEYMAPSASSAEGFSSGPAAVSPPASMDSPPKEETASASSATIDQASPGPSPAIDTNLSNSAPENPPEAASSGAVLPGNTPELELQIDSIAAVWLSIIADGEKQWQGTLQPNQTRQVKASDSILLTVGDAGAVDLSLNGNSLPPLGHAGQVRKITITSKGLAPTL